MCKQTAVSSGFLMGLPADAGNQRLGPDRGDDKERLCRRFLDVLVAGNQEVPLDVVLRVQSVHLVGRLDDLSGHQARLAGAEAVHGVGEAAVCVVGADVVVFMAAVGGGAAGAMSRDQAWIPVHVVGAFALRGGGAGARSGGGRALD